MPAHSRELVHYTKTFSSPNKVITSHLQFGQELVEEHQLARVFPEVRAVAVWGTRLRALEQIRVVAHL